MTYSIFLSHSSSDSELALETIKLLQLGLGMGRDQVTCTSKPEEIPSGEAFVDVIRRGLNSAKAVALLITPDFLDSSFCIAELGAAWVSGKPTIPLLAPPLDHSALASTPLANVQCKSISLVADWRTVLAEISKLTNLSTDPVQSEPEIERYCKFVEEYSKKRSRARAVALDRSVDKLMAALARNDWQVLEQRADAIRQSITALREERYRALSEKLGKEEVSPEQAWEELQHLRDHYGELDDPDDLFTKYNPEIVKLRTVASSAANHVVGNALIRIANPRTSPVDRKVCGDQLARLGDPRPGVGVNEDGMPAIEWVEIPEGPFRVGIDKEPDRTERFLISKYPITNSQFRSFMESGEFRNKNFYLSPDGVPKDDISEYGPLAGNSPVVNVTWHEANAFCLWLGQQLGIYIRLPTAREWEKAARGPNGREYPYGNKFDAGKGNTRETNLQSVVAVGLFPHGISSYGVHDMGGLVWNWTDSYYQYNEREGKILKGGSFRYAADYARAFSEGKKPQDYRSDHGGFRIACDGSDLGSRLVQEKL